MKASDYDRELVRHKIDTNRKQIGLQLTNLKHELSPPTAATALGRLTGGRLGKLAKLGPVLGLVAKGPGVGTWVRVGALAYVAAPLVLHWLSRRKARRAGDGSSATPATAGETE